MLCFVSCFWNSHQIFVCHGLFFIISSHADQLTFLLFSVEIQKLEASKIELQNRISEEVGLKITPLDVSTWSFMSSFFTSIICCIFLRRSKVMPFCKPSWKNERRLCTIIVKPSSKMYVPFPFCCYFSLCSSPFQMILPRMFTWPGLAEIHVKSLRV